MNAAFRISPNWDFVGQPRLVLDDQIEARAAILEKQYAADPARISEALCEALTVTSAHSYRDSSGAVHSYPGTNRGLPLIQMLLAHDDIAVCSMLREIIAIKAKTDAANDASDDVLRGAA